MSKLTPGPIGIFDSGYGGLSVFKSIDKVLPQYDYIYLGDNARAPYGTRSFHTIYKYTWEAVQYLFEEGCNLVILACNTASAKALRNIQQINLKIEHPDKRVLGIIRPTTEIIGNFSTSNHIGILATPGTVASKSYEIEINKFFPEATVFQQAAPMLVSLIENFEYDNDGADYFIKKYIDKLMTQSSNIDTLLLACTHYPLILEKIQQHVGPNVKVITQGDIVAKSLQEYLQRHDLLNDACTKNNDELFLTTGDPTDFKFSSSLFLSRTIHVEHAEIG